MWVLAQTWPKTVGYQTYACTSTITAYRNKSNVNKHAHKNERDHCKDLLSVYCVGSISVAIAC